MSFFSLSQFNENLDSMRSLAAEKGWLADIKADILAAAFPPKRGPHPGMSGVPVPENEREMILEKLRSQPRSGATTAYVHLPYCESHCLFCGFFGGKYNPKAGLTYLDALLWEIETESQYRSAQQEPINALYLGGGTPTALQADELLLLLNTLRRCLPLANDCEITVEARTFNFGREKIEACLKGGANRFSLGVQSFNTDVRRRLGRISSREEVIDHLEILSSYNQAAIVIDLIYGLPGQRLEDWKDDIRTFLDLSLDGVDLYQLSVFPGGTLHKVITAGKIPPAALLHEQGPYFFAGINLMQEARYNRLSISHWGRTRRERNAYNPLTKSRAPCLNFGCAAGGSLHGYSMSNERKADDYLAKCNDKIKPISFMMYPPKGLPAMRTLLEHMELCRLQLDVLTKSYENILGADQGFSAETFFAPLLDNWNEAGLIKRSGAWMELTPVGEFWQANMIQALVGWHTLAFQEFNYMEAD